MKLVEEMSWRAITSSFCFCDGNKEMSWRMIRIASASLMATNSFTMVERWAASAIVLLGVPVSSHQVSNDRDLCTYRMIVPYRIVNITYFVSASFLLDDRFRCSIVQRWTEQTFYWPLLYVWCSWPVLKDSKHTEASFSPIPRDSFALQVVQVPRSSRLAIFMPTTDITLPLLRMRMRMCAG